MLPNAGRHGELPYLQHHAVAHQRRRRCKYPHNQEPQQRRAARRERCLPKAEDEATARKCLELLSGRRHRVLSAIALRAPDGAIRERLSETVVMFKRLSSAEIDAYLASGEWEGMAGGYAIQGIAEGLISRIQGSHSGVVGLPLYETRTLLRAAGFDIA